LKKKRLKRRRQKRRQNTLQTMPKRRRIKTDLKATHPVWCVVEKG
jgi:hypothetical protein